MFRMGMGRVLCFVASVLALTSTSIFAQVNSWINPTSGNWDDASSWSLGILPGSSQSIMITNSGFKAVAINSSTPINFPGSMSVSNLTITSPTNGANTLLMNYVAAGNPLVIGVDSNNPGSLIIGDTNSAVVMFSSGLIVNNALGTSNSHLGEFEVNGTFTQSDSSEVVAGFLDLTGTYNFTNSQLFVGTQFINGTFNQQGGTNLGSVDMESTNGDYQLFDGAMQGNVILRAGTFNQWGGINSASLITGFRGVYNLAGGVLMPGDLVVGSPPQNNSQSAGGGIQQSGGTNIAGNISMVFGFYYLSNGTLSASSLTLTTNTLLGAIHAGEFNQYGGYNTNGVLNIIGGANPFPVDAFYFLYGGTLETPSINMDLGEFDLRNATNRVATLSLMNHSIYEMESGLLDVDEIQLTEASTGSSQFSHLGGTLAGARNVTLANGQWLELSTGAQFGQLRLGSGTNSVVAFQTTAATCVLSFADSSSVSWAGDGILTIQGWAGSLNGGGSQQLLFGTSASGLTAQQLSQIEFINPAGLPFGTYSAEILSDGEVLPNPASSTSGPVNSWINPGSGNWDDASSWSLGVLPNSSQSILIVNTNWKAVAINPSTPINFPGSMTVTNLTILGATNTQNTLLLNYFGTAVPLTILDGLTLQDQAQILDFNSGLVVEGGFITVTNSQINQDGGFFHTTTAQMNLSDSVYNLTNGDFEGNSVLIGYPRSARFNQYGGTAIMTNVELQSYISGPIPNGISLYGGTLNLPGGMNCTGGPGGLAYFQAGGTNQTGNVFIGPGYGGSTPTFTLNGGLLADNNMTLMSATDSGAVAVNQNGGSHVMTNGLSIQGASEFGEHAIPATYNLNTGTLSAGSIELDADEGDSVFVQSNGITSAGTIYSHSIGYYSQNNTHITLLAGMFSCSNYTNTDGGGTLNQTGGALVVSNLLAFGGARYVNEPFVPYIYGTYTFTGGTVTASNISLSGYWLIGDGSANRISNPGTFSLLQTLVISNAVEQLGHFILASNATINLAGSASRLSFANSSGQTWAGGATLVISNWNGSPSGGGAEQLKFGTDQTGLTSAQLNQVQFRLGTNSYSAQILNTGEIVPGNVISSASLAFSQQGNNLVLTWPAGWTLQSATNASGPYGDVTNATSPYTNNITLKPQEFFRLRQ